MKPKDFYNKIADSWYNIRHWPLFKDRLTELSNRWGGGKLLNVGCAHGADFLPFGEDRFELYGTDIAMELLKKAQKYEEKFEHDFRLVASDMLDLPFRDESFDYVICVATLHHLLSRDERTAALEEMKRVIKEGGEIFITVLNKWHPNMIMKDKITELKWNYRDNELGRKYYLHTYSELKEEIRESGMSVLEMFGDRKYKFVLKYFSKNVMALAEK